MGSQCNRVKSRYIRNLYTKTRPLFPYFRSGVLNAFNRDYLNPYLNFHRPCFFPEVIVDAKGKQRKRYPYERMMTPYEKLKSLPKAELFLKPGVSFEQLNALAL